MEKYFRRVWLSVRPFVMLVAKIFIVITFMFIGCAARGAMSVMRLGAVVNFLFLWSCLFSLPYLVGWFVSPIFLVLCVILAFFTTFSLALLIFCGMMMLFSSIYGSFWWTLSGVFASCVVGHITRARYGIALCATCCLFALQRIGGWWSLVGSAFASFVTSDLYNTIFLPDDYQYSQRPSPGSSKARPKQGYASGQESYSRAGASTSGPSHSGHAAGGSSSSHTGAPSSTSYEQSPGAGSSSAHKPSTNQRKQGSPPPRPSPPSGRTPGGGGDASRAGSSVLHEAELSLDVEITRLLSGQDHYVMLGLTRYAELDELVLKKEYRKKALLVHPDKNVGNAKCEEAFKVLQNAYEVLKDPEKKKEYDAILQMQEIEERVKQRMHKMQQQQQQQQQQQSGGRESSEGEGFVHPDARRIFCSRCSGPHIWMPTSRSKSHARYCQDCRCYHPAKDGDGWMEQTGKWVFFGFFFQANPPEAYACSDGKVYNVTDWVECQGLTCDVNTHRSTFKVSTATPSKESSRGKQKGYGGRGGGDASMPDFDNMTEEEFFQWLSRMAREEGGGGEGGRGGGKKNKKKGRKQKW